VESRLTRRTLIATGAAAASAIAFPTLARGAKGGVPSRKLVAVYRLTPSGPCGGGADGACRACVSHDSHSLFPTAKAADGNRAHVGCNCCVQAGKLDQGAYVALFGPGGTRAYRVDTRSRNVAAILKQSPPAFS
jgi:hypothetical protein